MTDDRGPVFALRATTRQADDSGQKRNNILKNNKVRLTGLKSDVLHSKLIWENRLVPGKDLRDRPTFYLMIDRNC